MIREVLSIGVYGFTEAVFVQRLLEARVDLLCDVRARRSVRGSQYAFANSQRLQAILEQHGISYLHLKALAPNDATRQAQKLADKQSGITKRQRARLSEAFIERYRCERLLTLDLQSLLAQLGEASAPCFLCVEQLPSACHRSLLVDHLAREFSDKLGLAVPVKHLLP